MQRLREQIAREGAKLEDPRFATMREGIERNIAKMEEALIRLEKKDKRRQKKRKEPDPAVIASFDMPVNSADRQISSYESIVMQPMRDKKSAGEWLDNVKAAHEKNLRERHESKRQLEQFLSHPRMQQAAVDLQSADLVMDRNKLMSLMPSDTIDLPRSP